MTKAKMWVALATAAVTGLAAMPLADLPGWAAALVTGVLGAAGALGVYKVENKPLAGGPVHYRDEPFRDDAG